MKEEVRWKPVLNYEGYEVSELGQVRSMKRNKILKAHPNKNYKYLQVALWKNSKMKLLYLHRVVAEAFIDNPNGYNIVRHIDGDVTNNTVSNLIWAETPNYRNQYSKD